ncbi:hypothetical protein [Nostoc sp.]|uniref:hypothetical protein n=1 Tax=Nostoc sp. TaxID=1180 RepID=UPI002FFB1616
MTITPTPEWDEWWAEAAKNSQQNSSEPFERRVSVYALYQFNSCDRPTALWASNGRRWQSHRFGV